jgi:hypothetical protein
VAEELMFRGWLWTGLRRQWGGGATALATGALFALAHLGQGLPKVIAILPLAILLSIVRATSGGITGTILLHVINNAPVLIGCVILLTQGVAP